jgi:hypothetical protein
MKVKNGLVPFVVGIRSGSPGEGTIDRSSLAIDLSKSISVGTRKMVIYA